MTNTSGTANTPGLALEVRNLTLRYGADPRGRGATGVVPPAVDDAGLGVADGEIVALLGPSGSGKSSLLRAIAGIETIEAGQILVRGRDVTDVPIHERGIGMVFQDGQLFANRNVERNIAYGLEVAGVAKGERLDRVNELLELVGLAGYNEREISTLSGGQAQRVALARTLAPRPAVLLLDEPLSALDVDLRMSLGAELRRIIGADSTPALYVTHDRAEARAVADRTLWIADGHLSTTAPN